MRFFTITASLLHGGLISSMPTLEVKRGRCMLFRNTTRFMDPPVGDAFAPRNEFAMKMILNLNRLYLKYLIIPLCSYVVIASLILQKAQSPAKVGARQAGYEEKIC